MDSSYRATRTGWIFVWFLFSYISKLKAEVLQSGEQQCPKSDYTGQN